MIKYIMIFLFAQFAFAQTTSTFFSDAFKNVDDAMVFDTSGNLYGSNFNGDTVYKITTEGVATAFVTGLLNPNGLAFDDDGNLYVAEYSEARINKYDENGSLIDMFFTGGLTSGLIRDVNSTGFIFTNVSENSINLLNLDGTIDQLYQGSPLLDPVGLAFDDAGQLYVGNFTGRMIHKVTSGVATYVATVPNGNALGFIAFAGGNLYGTNFGGHEIYVINPNGVDDIELYCGSTQGNVDGPIESSTFNTPNGIIFNAEQNALYISEFSVDGNIRKIDNAVLNTSSFEFKSHISVYPNPASNVINIESVSSKIQSILIFDINGKIVLAKTYDAVQEVNLDISNLDNGLYLIQLEAEDAIITKKIVKQ